MVKGYYKLLIIAVLFLCANADAHAQKQKVWVDADTGNETDDVYALVRLLADTAIEVTGVSSAHFNNADLVRFEKWNQYDTRNINTVQISQQLNEALLQAMGKLFIAHPLGADRQMGRAWGGREARNSAAAQQLTAAVKSLDKNETLAVICLGALTNIASAIALDTAIAAHLVCYALGAGYDMDKHCWNKNEFNIRNDLNAFDYLLDNTLVNLVIMPVSTARGFRFERDALYAVLNQSLPVQKMLRNRWEETNPQDAVRTLWDLALAEAFVHPAFAAITEVLTPQENTRRMVKVYSRISEQEMKDDFFESVKMLGR